MATTRSIRRAVHLALLTSAAAAFQVQAQSIDEVVVTGSRIARPDFESASPIVSVDAEAFQKNATLSVETLLNTLPQFVPSITNTSNNPSNGGQANVSLRGLGTARTLVLLEGRRIVPSNGTGVVDVNLIPPSLLSGVETISGGASAVYGSDAVAGVVNFKLKDLQGLEFQSNVGQTSESDGREYQLSLSGGMSFAEDRGKLLANVSYADREAVLAGARERSRIAKAYVPASMTFAPTGSATVEEGSITLAASQAAIDRVFQSYGVAPGTVVNTTTFGFNTDGTLFSFGNGAANSVRNFRGAITDSFNDRGFSYNFAPTNYLQLPLERTSAFVRASYEFSPSAEVYVQGLFGKYTANTQLAATPATTLFIPVTNPFVSADLAALAASRSNPNAPLSLTKRVTELGPRFANNDTDVYQLTLGVKGDLFASSDWSYDLYGSYGKVEIDIAQLGSISRSRFEQLTFAADGGRSQCQGGLNPFGLGSISAECADFIRVDAHNNTEVKQTVVEGVINGSLFKLPAGDVQAAFGAFYKKDEFASIVDDALRAKTTGAFGLAVRDDVAGFNASANVIGETDSNEFYIETLVPILTDMPGVKRLDATVGYRYADYSTAGGVNSYKGELVYQPVSQISFRSSYQRAVRAPNIQVLFQPLVTNFPAITAPESCSINSAARAANNPNAAAVRSLCIAQGLPANLVDRYVFNNRQVEGLTGGNPELTEETVDTVTTGLVFRSESSNPWLSNLQVSVDYYRINIQDAIGVINASTFVARCYDPKFNPTFSTDNFYCSFFSRDANTGQITRAMEVQRNNGAIDTAGVDIQLDWAADLGPGRLAMNIAGSWLDKYDVQEIPGDPFTHRVDTINSTVGSAYPRWKGTVNTTYSLSGWNFNTRVRYVNTLQDQGVRTFSLPSITYVDAGVAYGFRDGPMRGLTLRAGVTNLADREPILYPSAVQANTDPSTYDVLGRRYSASVSYSFK